MIEVKIKTVWQGTVGIRDKYIKEAVETKQGLFIKKKDENLAMTIPVGRVREKIVGKSDKPMKDHFGNDSHYLYYFKWEPVRTQEKLL